jgi:hypothetical protein
MNITSFLGMLVEGYDKEICDSSGETLSQSPSLG